MWCVVRGAWCVVVVVWWWLWHWRHGCMQKLVLSVALLASRNLFLSVALLQQQHHGRCLCEACEGELNEDEHTEDEHTDGGAGRAQGAHVHRRGVLSIVAIARTGARLGAQLH